MIYWLFRQIQSIRKALAGRQHPEQLAWAVAIGVWIGLVPAGNLVSISLVVLALCLNINHAMAAITAVAVAFAGVVLDPFTNSMGQWVLDQPTLQGFFAWSWQQPLVPWTDLNNTVVMGSLLLGAMTLFPAYSLSLPLFKSIAKKAEDSPPKRPETQAVTAVDVRKPALPDAVSKTEVVSEQDPSAAEEPSEAADAGENAPEQSTFDQSDSDEAGGRIEQPDARIEQADADTSEDEEDAVKQNKLDDGELGEGPREDVDVIQIRRPSRRKVKLPGETKPDNSDDPTDDQENAA